MDRESGASEELEKYLTPGERRVLDSVLGANQESQPHVYHIPVEHCPLCSENHGHVAFYILPDEQPTILWALCPRKVDALIATIDIGTLPGKARK